MHIIFFTHARPQDPLKRDDREVRVVLQDLCSSVAVNL